MTTYSSILEATPATLRWENITIQTKPTRNRQARVILNNARGQTSAGEFLAILGPSGAGKTTLLHFLSGKYIGDGLQKLSGDLTLNHQVLPKEQYKRLIGFVPQDDILLECLTPREALQISADISLRGEKQTRYALVEDIIDKLGIQACSNTKIGGELIRGISGGERKRTSIGVELITNPHVLFLDEPTTGLDSFTALKIIEMLVNLAKEQHRAVIATIHQPNSEIFLSFDKLLLLSQGNTVYCGDAKGSVDWFKGMGSVIPQNYNPADYYMNLLSNKDEDITEMGKLDQLIEKTHRMSFRETIQGGGVPEPAQQPSEFVKFLAITRRNVINVIRNPMILAVKIIKLVWTVALTLVVYWDIGTSYDDRTDRLGMIFLLMMTIFFETLTTAVTTCNFHTVQMDKAVFFREYSQRRYSIFTFFLSYMMVVVPFEVLFGFLFYALCYYPCNLAKTGTSFLQAQIISILTAMSGTSYGLMISAIAPNMEVASAVAPVSSNQSFFIPVMLTGGYIVNFSDIKDWFFIKWLATSRYAFTAFVRVSYIKSEFDENDDIDSDVSDQVKDDLNLPYGLWESLWILAILVFAFRAGAILILKLKSKKL